MLVKLWNTKSMSYMKYMAMLFIVYENEISWSEICMKTK